MTPILNFTRPTSDGRLALENHELAIRQSKETRQGRVPTLAEVTRLTEFNLDAMFAEYVGGDR